VPGIIVSRPVFNTLFKLAHEQGLSINAFLTRLLEGSGQTGLAQAAAATGSEAGEPADEMVNGAEVPAGAREAAVRAAEPVLAQAAGVPSRLAAPAAAAPLPPQQAAPVHPAGQANGAASGGGVAPAAPANGAHPNGHAAASGANGQTSAGAPAAPQAAGIWSQVVSMAGRKFATSRGKKFSYKISGEYVIVKESDARIPRSQFEKAQGMWPVSGPSRLVGVYAPSVVWSIMKEIVEQAAVPAAS
jgi:hypothetical protein